MNINDYEEVIGQTISDFYEKYIKSPNSDSDQHYDIAIEYTLFIISRFAALMEGNENG
jgi:hypothetical protein